MPASLPLGNDIVDLRDADNDNSAANGRFVDRVLAPAEHRALSRAANDGRVFWAYWAAKEAAFKALVKTEPDLVFSHRRFVVLPDLPSEFSASQGGAAGLVCHGIRRIPVSWVWTDDWMHCLTENGQVRPRHRISAVSHCRESDRFATLKIDSALPDASLAARLLALSLLGDQGIGDAQIVRRPSGRRPGPPQIVQRGTTLDNVDVSLSHDGRYAAAAIQLTRVNRQADTTLPALFTI